MDKAAVSLRVRPGPSHLASPTAASQLRLPAEGGRSGQGISWFMAGTFQNLLI